MLTGKLVRVRYSRDRILPGYLDAADASWLETAERLRQLFVGQEGHTRGELEEDVRETFGSDHRQLVHQGLAKLLEDRCEFEVVSGHPPEPLREAVFLAAAAQRKSATGEQTTTATALQPPLPAAFDRDPILHQVAENLGLSAAAVEQGLFADLKSEQRLVRFKDIPAERLLQRYNVALAQAVLLRSTGSTSRFAVSRRGATGSCSAC